MSENEQREMLVALGKSLFDRGYSVGTAGNISVRLEDGFLMTPTNSSLGRLKADRISKLDRNWQHISGDKPTKEVFLHRAVLEARPQEGAVVHLHSTYATALSCLASSDEGQAAMPALTPYFIMRVGRALPVVPYFRPGDPAMEESIRGAAKEHRALLLANHGPVIASATLESAVNAAEELEESAKLALLLKNLPVNELSEHDITDLLDTFG
ncbi:3-oxo-tetronate 4-phosphate decarboxylase [Carnimonas sp. R-84981]|uniref:3-oxo-tetronate 4-phosphate decarboxylase n=1 Tax=Carnimonas bestiolae TaxID=3402172 RepID=UPI003EDBEDD3